MSVNAVPASDPFAALNGGASATAVTSNDAGSADRFLKLLVAQMKNQDPLNPLDNAQVTSQMAQINTVDGINKLNATVKGLNAQFIQLQALQGANLVGHEVSLPGDRLAIADGIGKGGFELSGPVDQVRLEILGAGGQVIDTVNLGPAAAGVHGFEWPAGSRSDADGLRFRVSAGAGTSLTAVTPLMLDRVQSVSAGGETLTLQLQHSGGVSYQSIKTVN